MRHFFARHEKNFVDFCIFFRQGNANDNQESYLRFREFENFSFFAAPSRFSRILIVTIAPLASSPIRCKGCNILLVSAHLESAVKAHGSFVRSGLMKKKNLLIGISAIVGFSFFSNVICAESSKITSRLPQDEITYFLLPDRFENGDINNDNGYIAGDRSKSGFDPTNKGYYHGGDLKGLISRLDYIEKLGATAIWLAPVFKNKPVQTSKTSQSSGYHGYWITDFTTIDPHFGSEKDFRDFVNAAHMRGMKVYMDIITNHTADVIYFDECKDKKDCEYRDYADYPKWGYEPKIPIGEEHAKKPDWLNDIKYYTNRGNSKWWGESAVFGDFPAQDDSSGLDDLDTSNPEVADKFVDIYAQWIEKYKIDGFRIDTVKHVAPEFWQRFIPAIKKRAAKAGKQNFHIFAEVYIGGMNPGALSVYTKRDKMPSLLDFSFQSAIYEVLAKNSGNEILDTLFAQDIVYQNGFDTAVQLQTFVSNHDMGRFSTMLRRENPNISEVEILAKLKLANAMMMFLRGAPVIYSGDEQGFLSDGNDQDAREDMFPSKTPQYNDNDLIATDATTAQSNFDTNHPLFMEFAKLAKIRKDNLGLSRGKQIVRKFSKSNGIFAVSRIYGDKEYVIAFNTSGQSIKENVKIGMKNNGLSQVSGVCPTKTDKNGIGVFEIAPYSFSICFGKK